MLSCKRGRVFHMLAELLHRQVQAKNVQAAIERVRRLAHDLEAEETEFVARLDSVLISTGNYLWAIRLCKRMVTAQESILARIHHGMSLRPEAFLSEDYEVKWLGALLLSIFKHFRNITRVFYNQITQVYRLAEPQHLPILKIKTEPELFGQKLQLHALPRIPSVVPRE